MTHVVWVSPHNPLPDYLYPDEPITSLDRIKFGHRIAYYRKIWQRTPFWETRARIANVYKLAHEMRIRGQDVEVDHIVPLNATCSSGLHTVDNLQIISRLANMNKSNNYYPGMPNEQMYLLDPEDLQLELDL